MGDCASATPRRTQRCRAVAAACRNEGDSGDGRRTPRAEREPSPRPVPGEGAARDRPRTTSAAAPRRRPPCPRAASCGIGRRRGGPTGFRRAHFFSVVPTHIFRSGGAGVSKKGISIPSRSQINPSIGLCYLDGEPSGVARLRPGHAVPGHPQGEAGVPRVCPHFVRILPTGAPDHDSPPSSPAAFAVAVASSAPSRLPHRRGRAACPRPALRRLGSAPRQRRRSSHPRRRALVRPGHGQRHRPPSPSLLPPSLLCAPRRRRACARLWA